MNETLVTGLRMAAVGAALGVLFFGGLWLTLKRLPVTRHPCLLALSSAIMRLTIVLCGIWYFSQGDPVGVIAGLCGFMVLQVLATFFASTNVNTSGEKTPR